MLALVRLMPRGQSWPDADETIARLDPETRLFVAATAARRSELELRGSAAFTTVARALVELRADPRIVDLAKRAVAEESEHAGIYLSIARVYAGADVPAPREEPIEAPTYSRVGADGERLLRVVGMCSINETMACSFLELCLDGATAPRVKEGLRSVLEDEIRHARIGWAYLGLPDVGAAERRLVSEWLLPMLRAQWQGWCNQIATSPPASAPSTGAPRRQRSSERREPPCAILVLPGFARAGVDVAKARGLVRRVLHLSDAGRPHVRSPRPGRHRARGG